MSQHGDVAQIATSVPHVAISATSPSCDPFPPDWFRASLEALKEAEQVKPIHTFAQRVCSNLEQEDGELLTLSIAGHEVRVQPFSVVLGLKEADHQLHLAVALRSATRPAPWGWDAAEEFYERLTLLDGMAEVMLDVLHRRVKEA